MRYKTFFVVFIILYIFSGCSSKKVKPDVDIKQEIIKSEKGRLHVKKKEEKHFIDVAKIQRRYGEKAKLRAKTLNKLMNSLQNAKESDKITKVNDFFNLFTFTTDLKLWNMRDYWATRTEFIGRGAGDCEDFVIAKYFTLGELGVSIKKLYFTYVKALSLAQAHMVLTYYKTPDSIPLVLDNIKKKILPATLREDLTPIYSFNANALYIAKKTGLGEMVKDKKNEKWVDLLNRMRFER